MAIAASFTGTGCTAVLGTVPLPMNLTSISMSGASRPAIKSSHLATTDADTFLPGELTDWGTIEIAGWMKGDAASPADAFATTALATLTITFTGSGSTSQGSWLWTSNAFLTDFAFDAPIEDMVSFTASIKVSGAPALTAPV